MNLLLKFKLDFDKKYISVVLKFSRSGKYKIA